MNGEQFSSAITTVKRRQTVAERLDDDGISICGWLAHGATLIFQTKRQSAGDTSTANGLGNINASIFLHWEPLRWRERRKK